MRTTEEKENALLKLAEKRKVAEKHRQACTQEYRPLVEYHSGAYECDYVSPWSKSAHNVDAKVMIVGHDWSSEKWLSGKFDKESAERGYSSRFPTNRHLCELLERHFTLKFSDVYATNAYPFVKKGGTRGSIRQEDMNSAVRDFLLHQIQIVEPIIVICLGVATFNAVRIGYGENRISNLAEAIEMPFSKNPMIYAVAHTGSLTTNIRGREQVNRDWAKLRQLFDNL